MIFDFDEDEVVFLIVIVYFECGGGELFFVVGIGVKMML